MVFEVPIHGVAAGCVWSEKSANLETAKGRWRCAIGHRKCSRLKLATTRNFDREAHDALCASLMRGNVTTAIDSATTGRVLLSRNVAGFARRLRRHSWFRR